MGFLDKGDVKWADKEFEGLRDLFVEAYPRDRTEILQLAESAPLEPGTFPDKEKNIRITWGKLIEVAASQGKLRQLVVKAIADPTKARFKDRFEKILASSDGGTVGNTGPKRTLYISHCATEGNTLELLALLRAKLKEQGYEVVPAGDRTDSTQGFDRGLQSALGRAHAAVILLSKSALESPAVAKEVSILSARHLNERNFKMLSILVDAPLSDLQPPASDDWGLHSFYQENPPLELRSDKVAAAVMAMIAALGKGIPPRSPLEILQSDLVNLLQNVELQDLRDAAATLDAQVAVGDSSEDLRRLVVALLWGADFDQTAQALAVLKKDGNALIVEWLKPMWVDPCAARWLIVAAKHTRQRALLMQGKKATFIARSFIRRAYCLSPTGKYSVVPVPLTEMSTAASTKVQIQEIRQAIKEVALRDGTIDDEEFTPALNASLKLQPIIVLIEIAAFDAQLVEQLLNAFSESPLPFFFLLPPAKETAPPPLDAMTASDKVLLVRPQLKEYEDVYAYRLVKELGGNPEV